MTAATVEQSFSGPARPFSRTDAVRRPLAERSAGPADRLTASTMYTAAEAGNDSTRVDTVTEPARRPDELLLEGLTDQIDRTRGLLTGSPDAAAVRALERMGREAEAEARIAAELAVRAPLAQPDRFAEAHRLAMRALEVLDREGAGSPRVPNLGPVTPLAQMGVAFVTDYIVKAYASSVVDELRTLYARRESQCPPELPERRLLARARVETERVAPGYSGGGKLPAIIVGGAAAPALAWLAQRVGGLDYRSLWVLLGTMVVMFVLFGSMSWVLLHGAAVARRRSRLIMGRPLADLWETIGHCGDPPEDGSVTFASLAIVLTALSWFALPAGAAVAVLLR